MCPILWRDGDRLGWGCEEDAFGGFGEAPGGSLLVPGGYSMVGRARLLSTAAGVAVCSCRAPLEKPADTKHGYLLFSSAVRAVPNAVTISAVNGLFLLASHAREQCKVCVALKAR